MTTSNIDEIWDGDRLHRKDEAQMLERFLMAEIEALKEQNRSNSYVLALDARYGEGKSWFLDRFAKQLRANHPVAFVDAWIDDANDEPLVAIMSAIEDALAPFLSKDESLASSFKAVTRAALPIIGKVIVGAATKATEKYLGDAIGSEVSEEFSKAKGNGSNNQDTKGAAVGAIEGGVTNAGKAIESLVDKQAEAMLDAYRKRKKSREAFKANMISLTTRIEHADPSKYQPLFIVVDELDRCRPSYAIKLLEEIKHFFDVPGVVFIIALHGAQLTKSISAVYGPDFDSQSYLQRFFSRRYEMRRLSVQELVVYLMSWWTYDEGRFEYPPIQGENNLPEMVSAAEFAGQFLEEFGLTPRECFSIIDALRVFYLQWRHKTPIELPWVLALIILQHHNLPNRGESLPDIKNKMKIELPQTNQGGYYTRISWSDVHSFTKTYFHAQNVDLPAVAGNLQGDGANAYLRHRLQREFAMEHGNSFQEHSKPYPLWREYWSKLREIGRFSHSMASTEEDEGER